MLLGRCALYVAVILYSIVALKFIYKESIYIMDVVTGAIFSSKQEHLKAAKVFAVFFVLLLALFLRLQVVSLSANPTPVRADAVDYFMYSYNLNTYGIYSKSTEGFAVKKEPKSDSYRTPGYPFFLMPFINESTATIDDIDVVLYAQSILSFIAVIFFLFLAQKIFPFYISIVPAFFLAISPHIVNSNVYVLTESLFSSLLIAAIFACFYACNRKMPYFWITVGIVIGFASLVRPTLQFYILVPVGLVVFSKGNEFLRKKWITIFLLLGFFIIFGPWLIFKNNYVERNESDPRSLLTVGIYHGMFPDMMYQDRPETRGYAYRFDPNAESIPRSFESLGKELYRRFTEAPLKHATWYLLKKPMIYWQWDTISGWKDTFVYPLESTPYHYEPIFRVTHIISKITYPLVMLFALLGNIIIWIPAATKNLSQRSVFTFKMISLLIIYFTLLHVVFAPYPRYSVPLKPFIFMMAMFPVSCVWRYFANRSEGSSD